MKELRIPPHRAAELNEAIKRLEALTSYGAIKGSTERERLAEYSTAVGQVRSKVMWIKAIVDASKNDEVSPAEARIREIAREEAMSVFHEKFRSGVGVCSESVQTSPSRAEHSPAREGT